MKNHRREGYIELLQRVKGFLELDGEETELIYHIQEQIKENIFKTKLSEGNLNKNPPKTLA